MLNCVVHAPPNYKQALQKDVLEEEHDSIINDLPITKDSYIHPFPNQVAIHQKFTHDKQEHYIFIPGIVGKPR